MTCPLCKAALLHTHGASPRELVLKKRWALWADEWQDRDMLQALIADTLDHLIKGEEQS